MFERTFDFRTKLVFLIPAFAIVFNCMLSFFPRQSGLALFKGAFFVGLLVYLYIGKFMRSLNKFALFFLLILYWFMLLPLSTGQERSFEYILKNALSILMLPIGYCYLNSPPKLIRFVKGQLILLFIFVVFAILSNIFKWGVNQYGGVGGVRVGLYDAQLYGPACVIAMVPFVFQTNQLKKAGKYRILFVSFFSLLLLVLSIRRTSILIVLAGISIFFTTRGKVLKLLSIVVLAGSVLLLTFPLYGGMLLERMEMRSNVFSSEYEMTEELRYQELFFVLKDLNDHFSIQTLLFGKEIFNSPGHYGFTDGFLAVRQLHVDYTLLFHGSGLIGLLLYLALYFHMFRLFKRKYSRLKSMLPRFAKDLRSLFITCISLLLLIHFSGQMEELTFRSAMFLTLGGCLGVLYQTDNAKLVPVQVTDSGKLFTKKKLSISPV